MEVEISPIHQQIGIKYSLYESQYIMFLQIQHISDLAVIKSLEFRSIKYHLDRN